MYNWYNLFNLDEWLETELVSRTLSVFLDKNDQKEILVTQGNQTGITIDDVFLPLKFNEKNPYVIGDYAIFQDVNNDVWVGLAVD